MKIVMFYHSLVSDWNHGNAHFLRGIVKELLSRGHKVKTYEPLNSWSLTNLLKDHGQQKINEYKEYYPMLDAGFYNPDNPDYDEMLYGADVVIVHEWNSHGFIKEIGKLKAKYGYQLLFHDTHHRAVSEVKSMRQYDFSNYDGALVFGKVIRDIYLENNWIKNVWVWHEAADTTLFSPREQNQKEGDLVWIGNWGDDERTEELMEFLINPVKELGLKAKVYGVRYPQKALDALADAGIEYGGWLPNYKVPDVFSRYKVTVHVPRGPYVKWLPGIPTIRPFEAMACGIPLVSSPWQDAENLFKPGTDFLTASNGNEMKKQLHRVLSDEAVAAQLSKNGRDTILKRHTCSHRADELELVIRQMGIEKSVMENVQLNPS
ncbi:glycosyltransferase [Flavobacterium sp. MK4S-17]|uniref:CgeB family protein n=1 Tax=Flavobacterium sp. MK4S-17 TaxID=2543737 RepID=UPI00135889C1|nr:glycosyltransferase [Flavobacterium sp. MK4S-17]